MRKNVRDRFLAKVKAAEGEDGCMLWTASMKGGSGQFVSPGGGGRIRAHRFAWELCTGKPPPAGCRVVRACGEPRCVRPKHLRVKGKPPSREPT